MNMFLPTHQHRRRRHYRHHLAIHVNIYFNFSVLLNKFELHTEERR